MKTLILSFTLLFTTIGFSQFTLATSGGNPIVDGDTFTYNNTNYPNASLEFVVTNTSDHPIDVVITVESMSNTDGSGMEICFGLCYSGIALGNSYPDNTPYNLLTGDSSEPNGNHFFNSATGSDTSQPVSYIFRFHEVDANGIEIGTPLRINYVYDSTSTTAISNLNQLNFNAFPTLVEDGILKITSDDDLTLTFYNTQGRIIKKEQITKDQLSIDISDLKNQIYFIVAEDKFGLKSLKTIIVK